MEGGDLCARVIEFLDSSPLDEVSSLTVQKLALRFGVTRFHLSRSMKEKRGVAISRYLLQVKMGKLAEWIEKHRTISVREMSYRSGFYSRKHFSRRFKEHFGVVPSMFPGNRQKKLKKYIETGGTI